MHKQFYIYFQVFSLLLPLILAQKPKNCKLRIYYYDPSKDTEYTEEEYRQQVADSTKQIGNNSVFDGFRENFDLSGMKVYEPFVLEITGETPEKVEEFTSTTVTMDLADESKRRRKRQLDGNEESTTSIPSPLDPDEIGDGVSVENLEAVFQASTQPNDAESINPDDFGALADDEEEEYDQGEDTSDETNENQGINQKALRRQKYLEKKERERLMQLYEMERARINNIQRRIYYDCGNLNTRVLPATIPEEVYDLNLNYNNIDTFCGLPVPMSALLQFRREQALKEKELLAAGNLTTVAPEILDANSTAITTESPSTETSLPEQIKLGEEPSVPHFLQLKNFDLSFNPLNEICDYSFTAFPNIEKIVASNTHIKTLTNKTFHSVTKAVSFELNFNGIKTLGPGTFANMDQLQFVEAAENEISELPDNLFANCTKMEKLQLSANLITSISNTTFTNCISMISIILYRNKIENLPDLALQDMVNLQTLDMGSNKIKSITDKTFTGLAELVKLNLDTNEISFIHENAFVDLKNLKTLTLNKNRIAVIEPKWFEAGVLATHIDAQVTIKNNEISCGCESTKFKLWLESNKTINKIMPEDNNKDFFFRVVEADKNRDGLPCAKPAHLRNSFRLDSMNITWFPQTAKEAETKCLAPRKNSFIFTRYFYETKPIDLQCVEPSARTFPPPHRFWMTPTNETFYTADGKLLIENSKQEQTGIYICEIINIVAKVQIKYQITVYWTGSIIDCDGNIVDSDFGTDHIDKFEENCQEIWAARDALAEKQNEQDYVYSGEESWEDYDYGDNMSNINQFSVSLLVSNLLMLVLFFM